MTGDTEDVVRRTEEFFRGLGIPTDRLAPPGVAPVLVAGRPPKPGVPTFLLATHLDTVKVVGTPSRVAGTTEEGRLYGRGAVDMKGGVALAMLLLQEFHNDPRFNLGFAGTTDEEAESGGAWALVEGLRDRPDLVLVTEPTWEDVVLSASGRVVWQVRFAGRGGHGHHQKAASAGNPLVALSELVLTVRKDYTPLRWATEGEGEVTLAHSASVRLDRLLPRRQPLDAEKARAEDRDRLGKIVSKVAKGYPGLNATIEYAPRKTPWLPEYDTPKDDPWVRLFLESTARDGKRAKVVHKEAVGDYNVFGSRFPTVGLGPAGDGMHGDDEWLDLISLERCWHAYRRFFVSVPEKGPGAAPTPSRPPKP